MPKNPPRLLKRVHQRKSKVSRKLLFTLILLITLPIIVLGVYYFRYYRVKAQQVDLCAALAGPGGCISGLPLKIVPSSSVGGILGFFGNLIPNNCMIVQASECPFNPQVPVGFRCLPQGADPSLISLLPGDLSGQTWCIGSMRVGCNFSSGMAENRGTCDVPTDNSNTNSNNTSGNCRNDCALCNYNDPKDQGNGCKPETLCNGEAKWCWPFGYSGSPNTPGSVNNPGGSQTGVSCAGKNCNWQIFCVKGSDYPGKECIPNGEACEDKPDKDVCRDSGCTGCQ